MTPYVIERTSDDPERHIELRSPGYQPMGHRVTGAYPQRIHLRLTAEPAPPE